MCYPPTLDSLRSSSYPILKTRKKSLNLKKHEAIISLFQIAEMLVVSLRKGARIVLGLEKKKDVKDWYRNY